MISHGCSSPELSDKGMYPFFSRTTGTYSQFDKALAAFVQVHATCNHVTLRIVVMLTHNDCVAAGDGLEEGRLCHELRESVSVILAIMASSYGREGDSLLVLHFRPRR